MSLALVCVTLRARSAEATIPLSVDREPGAEDCPDTDLLVAQVQAVLGHGTGEMTAYHVTFSRSAQTLSAEIRGDAGGAVVRRLEATEPNCAALAHATAVALAVLYDSDRGAANDEPPASAPPAVAPLVSPTPASPPPPRAPEKAPSGSPLRVAPLFSAGAAAVAGVVSPIAPALLADAGGEISNFRVTLGVLWILPQTTALSPGSIRQNVLGGTLRGCYVAWRGKVPRLSLCTGALAGAISAEATGFTVNESRSEPFLAFPVEVAFAAGLGIVSWELGAAALVLLPPNEFQIEGRGSAYHPSPIAGVFTLRAMFGPR